VSGQPGQVLNESERRWLRTFLILGSLVLAFVLLGQVATILLFFSDILLIVLLAWLLAFMISPVVRLILRALPFAPRAVVVAFIYLAIGAVATWLIVTTAANLAASISNFVEFAVRRPEALERQLTGLLAPWQAGLADLGIRVNLVQGARDVLQSVAAAADELVGPLTGLAVASVGVVAQLLIVVFLSLFIVLDQERITAYLNRLVPPRWAPEARLFETSVASSFGGFIRGQAIQGVMLALIAWGVHWVLGLDFLAASAGLVGVLQAIPFFGPALSWAPPVVVALLTKPGAVLPALIAMAVGWFVVNNIVLPRVMASAVGIHPVAVLISVLVGLKIAGIAGAIFALPVAAVMAAFFHHFLLRNAESTGDVATRAARRLERRQGRPVRVPTPPTIAEGTSMAAADAGVGEGQPSVEPGR
jgi:predicted PurR-regulated permease PerM